MSVTICADGDFKDQADELLRYIAREKAEEEQEAFVSAFALDGDRNDVVNRLVGEVKDLGAGTDKETEGFFNLLLAVILSAHPLASAEFASLYPQLLLAVTASPDRRRSQYQVLSNLHNLLPASSPLRLPTISALLEIAAKNGELAAVELSPSLVKTWVGEWAVSDEEKAAFVEKVAELVAQSDEQASYPYRLLALSLPSASPSSVSSTLKLALRLPQLLSFDSLLASPALATPPAGTDALLSLLAILRSGSLADLRQWQASHGSVDGVDAQVLEKKMRLLTLVGLCAAKTEGEGEVSYAEIAKALEVEEKDVEVWVIDAIRLKLIAAKLSQPTRSVRVQRAYIRSFGPAEWSTLQARLAAWDENLANVESVVSEAKQIGEGLHPAGGPSSRPE